MLRQLVLELPLVLVQVLVLSVVLVLLPSPVLVLVLQTLVLTQQQLLQQAPACWGTSWGQARTQLQYLAPL